MEIDGSIFKAYDIRGTVPDQLNEEIMYRIGRAIVEFLGCKKVVVGMDMRDTSDNFSAKLMEGLKEQGADVIFLGLCTTPMNYYANGKLDCDASVMVTASHNPAGWNGVKICKEKAIPLSGETGIMDIKELVIKNEFKEVEEKGKISSYNILDEYCHFIDSHYHNKEGKVLTVVADCANAMGVEELKALTNLPNLKIIPLYDTLDANFPNHEANPLKLETLKDLQEKVLDEEADLGIAFDGDADRCGFIDENGDVIRSDFITALIAKDILEENPQEKVFYDLRSSKVVKEVIEKTNGIPLMCRVGHAFIKEQMRQEGAVFAGELSGHYYFKENFNAESSSLAAVRIINMILKKEAPLSELAQELKVYSQSGEINRKVSDSKAVMQRLKDKYSDAKQFELDGITIEYDDWWFNVRSSNTEPVLRLNLEAQTEEMMEEKTKEVLDLYD